MGCHLLSPRASAWHRRFLELGGGGCPETAQLLGSRHQVLDPPVRLYAALRADVCAPLLDCERQHRGTLSAWGTSQFPVSTRQGRGSASSVSLRGVSTCGLERDSSVWRHVGGRTLTLRTGPEQALQWPSGTQSPKLTAPVSSWEWGREMDGALASGICRRGIQGGHMLGVVEIGLTLKSPPLRAFLRHPLIRSPDPGRSLPVLAPECFSSFLAVCLQSKCRWFSFGHTPPAPRPSVLCPALGPTSRLTRDWTIVSCSV